MTVIIRRILIIGATVGPLIFLGNVAHAVPIRGALVHFSVTDKPSPKPTKSRPPTTTGTQEREGVRLRGTNSSQGSRLNLHHPSKPEGVHQGKSAARANPANLQDATTAEVRRDLRLNVGMCKPLEMEGRVLGPNRCEPDVPDEPPVTRRAARQPVVRPRPQDVTWEQVLTQTRHVVFPGLSVKVQPAGRTLVNLDTIVYTDKSKVSAKTVTLLGFPVVVEATPISYSWNFGDGSKVTTSTPGRPYPAKDITHKYVKRGAVNLTLTTNYAARFNVADTGWQYVDGTIPVTGPATPLQVREAVPVLVDPDR